MGWRMFAALMAGLAVQLGLALVHLVRLVMFLDFHQGLMGGLDGVVLNAFLSGLVVGAIARCRPVLLGVLNAANPFSGFLFYYIILLISGALAAFDQNGFAGGLIAFAWSKLWPHFALHFAAVLLASVIGASLGVAFNPPRRAVSNGTGRPDRSPES
jgi:hypothetical protein